MQANRITLSDVALRADVSKATASRVLSGSRDRVSDELAERVLAAAAELQYVPNPHARALARAASPAVGVIVHDVGDPYFSEIARGALRVAAEHERLVMICATFRDPAREVAYVTEMRSQRIHAVLLAGSSSQGLELGGRLAAELDAYRSEGGRVAVMIAGHGHPAAVPDNVGGGRAAAEHLVGLGHRDIGVVAGPEHITSVADRLNGFQAVLADAGVPPPTVVHADFTREGGSGAAREVASQRPEATAVFALNDLMAIGVMRRFSEDGRRIPADTSVVGFDDIPLAGDLDPGLTTVRVPMEEIGAEAMRLALSDTSSGEEDRVSVFETTLVVRGSTAPPPASGAQASEVDA